MANRPTMSNMQKQIDELKRAQLKTNQEVKRHEVELKQIQKREIVTMLSEKNTPTSSRFRYTYDEIAVALGCSPATVSNIAREYGLSRRLKAVE